MSGAPAPARPRLSWWWLTPAIAGLIGVPFVLAQNSWFEWANALWLLKLQTAYVRTHGIPTFFVNAPEQVFYPVHLFYAGPVVSVLAYPSLLFGAWPVFAATTILAFVGLAAGVFWMARSLGVPGPYAAAPALLFATTPYLVSDLYGRGDWAELVALAGLSLVVGSATALLSGGPRRGRAFVVLVAASAVLAGTHNITLFWGAVIGVPLLALVILALDLPGRDMIGRALVALSAAALGAALCACFLVPNLALSSQTQVAQKESSASLLRAVNGFETPQVVFSPVLNQPKAAPTDLHTQTAAVAVLWTLIVVIGMRRRLGRRTLTLVAGVGVLIVAVSVLVLEPRWWAHLPSLVWNTQFTFRLIPYLTLGVLLAMVLLLRGEAVRGSRWATAGLILAVGWQAGFGAYQAVSAKGRSIAPYPPILAADVTASRVPDSFGGIGFGQPTQFRLHSARPIVRSDGAVVAPVVRTRPPDQVVVTGRQPPGSLISTNIVYSPLIDIRGDARLVGRDRQGLVVLSVTRDGAQGWRSTITGACPLCVAENLRVGYLPLEIGDALTVLAIVVLGALATLALRRTRLVRSGRRGAHRRRGVGRFHHAARSVAGRPAEDRRPAHAAGRRAVTSSPAEPTRTRRSQVDSAHAAALAMTRSLARHLPPKDLGRSPRLW